MLTAEQIHYLDAFMFILSEQGELFMDVFMNLVYGNYEFDCWVLEIFSSCDLELAIQIITSATERYIEHNTIPLNL
ncbi:hypothetical protein [Endozoicomonas euniceicola]|uniref:Uncharacterized protein n=1 Tax=Endozoicomonas euniceicola TaxID=1234143 RepID=A0ABY6GTV9_9GAMM|nr:hypothetical protein [Endozoicomonas euniceicola]UYM16190.1 hypothetical protein NX720_25905 [Endozoicomonas euniceicola]